MYIKYYKQLTNTNNLFSRRFKMSFGIFTYMDVKNEQIKEYKPGSPEKLSIKKELHRQMSIQVDIPVIIGGEEIRTGKIMPITAPHDHNIKLGQYHKADASLVKHAIQSAMQARIKWSQTPWEDRAAIFLKAAELLASPYRDILNASTMLGQSKNIYQAEIDICELVDFWCYNSLYMQKIYKDQPGTNTLSVWNRLEYRPLEGFIFAVTPFNFTSIAGNLPTSPALMGNVALWKPASSSVLSGYYIMQILKEAGLPASVINYIPGGGSEIGNVVLNDPNFSGIHFTGSTSTFNSMWKLIGENLSKGVYKTYPRIVGETGGKDFIIAYKDADIDALAVALVRGAFEYQGQKCSAASRAYIPKSIWKTVSEKMISMINDITIGDITNFKTFMGAVIDRSSYTNITEYIEYAKASKCMKILAGGKYNDTEGYFIHPTLIETTDPLCRLMNEEIFGPVMTVYAYEDTKLDETLDILDKTSPYALTGAVFAKDREIISKIQRKLVNAAGNFYINDKPTGAVVGQQPFGGSRMSGTNDKAGSYLNLIRWVSPRAIKENFNPATGYKYPYMIEE